MRASCLKHPGDTHSDLMGPRWVPVGSFGKSNKNKDLANSSTTESTCIRDEEEEDLRRNTKTVTIGANEQARLGDTTENPKERPANTNLRTRRKRDEEEEDPLSILMHPLVLMAWVRVCVCQLDLRCLRTSSMT